MKPREREPLSCATRQRADILAAIVALCGLPPPPTPPRKGGERVQAACDSLSGESGYSLAILGFFAILLPLAEPGARQAA